DNVNNAVAQRNLSLPEAASQRAAQATTSFVNPSNVQIGGVSVLSILNGFLSGTATLLTIVDESGRIANTVALTDSNSSITVDDATGEVVVKVPGETYSGMIVAVRGVPATVPNGITFRRDGRALIVSNGTAVELATNAADLIGFIASIENQGYEFTQRNNASFSLNLGGGQRFVGAFAYDNLVNKDIEACGAVTIGTPSGALNSPSYAFKANCANGIVQNITPFIDNVDFLNSLTGFGFDGRINRNTGIITVAGVGVFKPSFFVAPRTDAEKAYHAANKDSFGIAYQSGDFNGDGKLDFKVISNSGAQLLFGAN
ncbi:MAG: hypothetical protein KKD00_11875, partial [Gammaproteobacteria bacterium]|nr:hypothetical protein [Gammaproteobacteria bacterium]